MTTATDTNLDPEEVRRFSEIAAEWWNPNGKFKPLHQIGPPRLAFVRQAAVAHFNLDDKMLRPLKGLTAIDVGCGGGLVSEPLTRMGAMATGSDPAERNIAIAKQHAAQSEFAIDYRATRIEDVVAAGEQFDMVVCLEVIEHVPDVAAFVRSCAAAVKPGGIAVFSTINRTFKAWAFAIVGAEYILSWLPRGTHQWDRFVTPDELRAHAEAAGLIAPRFSGIVFDPLRDSWRLSNDTDVNYLVSFAKPT
jgi:2-polyprenyl-6-hydroxyphenyl methylase / 3-demethylubiquinone-9 3-methyltransferase